MKWLKRIVGRLVSYMVMPAQFLSTSSFQADRGRYFSDHYQHTFQIKNLNIKSTHGAVIDACEVVCPHTKGTATDNPDNQDTQVLRNGTVELDSNLDYSKKVIIMAFGNIEVYEQHFERMIQLAKQFPGTRIIGFNFRNVQQSKGVVYSQQDWIDDVLSVVSHYQQQGVVTSNILLYGYSLAAANLTLAAAQLGQSFSKDNLLDALAKSYPKLFSDRSFTNLVDVIMTKIKGPIGGLLAGMLFGVPAYMVDNSLGFWVYMSCTCAGFLSPNIVHACIAPLLKPLVKISLENSFGTLNALDAFQQVPEDHKDYVMAKGDLTIPEAVSLHKGLAPTRHKKKLRLKTQLLDTESGAIKDKIMLALNNIKCCKLIPVEKGQNSHISELNELITYYPIQVDHDSEASHHLSAEEVIKQKITTLLKSTATED